VNASREIVDALAAARHSVGGALPNAPWATKGRYEGWTTDVSFGLRYTELLHASHYQACSAPMLDKGMAAPLFEWTLAQLRAAGFDQHRALRKWAKKSPTVEPRRTREA
jgi:hypothetical protein